MWEQFVADWENAKVEAEGKAMANNAKTITVELTEDEARLIKSGLMFISDTTNLDEKFNMCWNIIDKMGV